MFNLIKKALGFKPALNYRDLIQQGAIVIDVRSSDEYKRGHVNESLNIPIDFLTSHLKKFDKEKIIITCCASGIRSKRAKTILESNGFTKVYNAGSWINLRT